MNILFLTLVYPEGENARGIYVDLMREFQGRGHNVTVITPIERRYGKNTYQITQNGINVFRVKTLNNQKTNIVEKGLSTLLIENQFLKVVKEELRDVKFDLVIYSTPPITFAKVIDFIKKRDNAKSYLLLKDIFPQNAVDMGMFRENGILHRFFKRKEKKLYRISDYIGCMSKKNKEFLLKNNPYLDCAKVGICPNSIKPLEYIKIDESLKIKIRDKYNIPNDKKVVVYGGNLGKPQGIDFLIDILKNNEKNEEVFYLIVGSGTEYGKLKSWIDNSNPKNCILYSMLPKDDYDTLISACDVGLILLDKNFTIPNFPSRILSYMEVSMPVIAATDVNTDIGITIEEGNFGYWCESGDIARYNLILREMISSEEKFNMLGKNSRVYLEKNYTVKESVNIVLKSVGGEKNV